MFQSLSGSLLDHLYPYANENVSVRHLSLSCITSILTTIYSLKNFSVYGRSCRIYSPKSFWFSQRISSSLKKLMYFQDLDHIFSQYVPPSRQITCFYDIIRPSIHLSSTNLFVFCLFVCFSFGRGRRGRDFISYLPYPCQLALHLQCHHNALPNSLSL